MTPNQHFDSLGQEINGPALYVTIRTSFILGGGRTSEPGKVMLVERARAVTWIHNGNARASTPEEIALFEAERARDNAALADARAGDDAAARAAEEERIETEVERRLAERMKAQGPEGFELEAEIQRRVDEALEQERAARKQDRVPPGAPGDVNTRDPEPGNRDPKTGRASGRGGNGR